MDIKRICALILSLLMLTGCSETTVSSSEDAAQATTVSNSELPYYGTTARTRATLPEPEIEESRSFRPSRLW